MHGITLLTRNIRITFRCVRAVCDKSIGLGKATISHKVTLSLAVRGLSLCKAVNEVSYYLSEAVYRSNFLLDCVRNCIRVLHRPLFSHYSVALLRNVIIQSRLY